MIKIFLVDDHKMVREGVKQLLTLSNAFEIVGEASNGKEFLDNVEDSEFDVLLLDLNMPIMSGIEVLTELKKMNKSIKIIILTIHNNISYMEKTMKLGASGYVLKDSSIGVLEETIKDVYNGKKVIDPVLLDEIRKYDEHINNRNKLTNREEEILKAIVKGLSNKEIAEKFNITEQTVKNHIVNLFRKIQVTDRTQAAVYAIKMKIIDL